MATEKRLIDKKSAWKTAQRIYSDPVLLHAIKNTLDNVPTVDAVEVVHGRWAHLGGDEWCCTACGEVIHTEGSWEKPSKKYCNECGAKMDGDGNG